ncbi:E3 ubiquitin ligase [Dispira parvispora]|uniref:E3 ubiquitin ligase n=1 Tax=Dispira parvispora TaxID=1520584 RepID=A0A9W8ANH5_9FUNG|nr:E3 ubiquitin ligase [Dispira parvispora]
MALGIDIPSEVPPGSSSYGSAASPNDLRKACHELRQQYILLYKLHDHVRQMKSYQSQVHQAHTKLTEGYTCAVCTDLYTKPCALECGHMFCQTCLVSWFQVNKMCPTCRKDVVRRPVIMFDVQTQVDALKSLEEVRPSELDPTAAVSLHSLFAQVNDQPELMRNLFSTHTTDTEDPSGRKELTNVLAAVKSLSDRENGNGVKSSTTPLGDTCTSAANKGKAPVKDPWEGLFSEPSSAPPTVLDGSGDCLLCGDPALLCRACIESTGGIEFPRPFPQPRGLSDPRIPAPSQNTLSPPTILENEQPNRLLNTRPNASSVVADLQMLIRYGIYDRRDSFGGSVEYVTDENDDTDESYSYHGSDTDSIPDYFDEYDTDDTNSALGVSHFYPAYARYQRHSDDYPEDTFWARQRGIHTPRASNPSVTTAPTTTTPSRVRSAATSQSTQTASSRYSSTNRPTAAVSSTSSRTWRSTPRVGEITSSGSRPFLTSDTRPTFTHATLPSFSMTSSSANNPALGNYQARNTTTSRPREPNRRSGRRSRQRARTGGNR